MRFGPSPDPGRTQFGPSKTRGGFRGRRRVIVCSISGGVRAGCFRGLFWAGFGGGFRGWFWGGFCGWFWRSISGGFVSPFRTAKSGATARDRARVRRGDLYFFFLTFSAVCDCSYGGLLAQCQRGARFYWLMWQFCIYLAQRQNGADVGKTTRKKVRIFFYFPTCAL